MADKPNNPPAGEAMTMRDYFAAKAMATVMSMDSRHFVHEEGTVGEVIARKSYQMADAMLKERAK